MAPSYDPGRYLRYDELTALLKAWAGLYPDLCALAEIATSGEGRAVWAMTLTNRKTGAAAEKPGYLLDANTHAGEVTGGAAALYAIHWLLTGYGQNADATELLDTRTFYVVPRLAVDGAELYLTTPHVLRSSPKCYPEPADLPGLYAEDVNGDGEILQMRMAHPDGDWKVDSGDSRLLVRRRPEDRGPGPYYKLYTEGALREWDGQAMVPQRRPWGLDFNRNYPAFWNPEGTQPGAGPYPLSESETRGLAAFLLSHPNIGAYVALHTSGGVLLRPPSYGADDKMEKRDLEGFRRIGEVCTRLTGYPCQSTYQAFAYPGQEALVKGADDWAYEHYGVQAYTMELWSLDRRAGAHEYPTIGVKGLMELSEADLIADERKRLAWQDAELGGRGFVPWTPFQHPQLGPVEIGGWVTKWALQNPPEGPLLVEEISKAAAFITQHALATPRLTITATAATVGGGLYKVSACVRNLGGLATNVTERALEMKAVRPIAVSLSGAAQILAGDATREIGHLEGWAATEGRSARQEAWVDWLVRGAPGEVLTVTAGTARAGQAVATVML